MKLIIKSSQNYGTHIDEFTEEFECSVKAEENILKIDFNGGSLILEPEKIVYERNDNKILIEANKITECDYLTEYGMFVLDIKCLSFNNIYIQNKKEHYGTIATAKYEIEMVGIEAYENSIEIGIEI